MPHAPVRRSVFVVLGNQLFPFAEVKPYRDCRFFMAEDLGLCTYVRHHQQKIALFLAAMRSHRDELRGHGCPVHYESLDAQAAAELRTKYETKLGRYLDGLADDVTHLVSFEVEDKFFERRLRGFADERGLEWVILPSPMFVTSRAQFAEYRAGVKRPHMATFYERQRKRLKVLVSADGEPVGGRWSFDQKNRERVPDDVAIPETAWASPTDHVRAVIPLVRERFGDHPGELSEEGWWLPTTRRQALAWLRDFLEHRMAGFGPYEDAINTRGPFLWHSVLSPVMNLGLLTPREIIDRALAHADAHDVPMNSLEGFVRQVIGWREFVRGVYRHDSERQDQANHFNARRRLTDHWYEGTTGVPPLDDTIKKAQRFGWTHHIERLMIVGNLMLTCEVEPREVHRWFMEMFVDSSDWVMGPNVYGMGIFSDGGIFATKPYLAGSNYLLKMSNYPKPKASGGGLFGDDGHTWADAVDGLYWRFIDKHVDYFKSNPRTAQVTGTLGRMKAERRDRISAAAEALLERITTPG